MDGSLDSLLSLRSALRRCVRDVLALLHMREDLHDDEEEAEPHPRPKSTARRSILLAQEAIAPRTISDDAADEGSSILADLTFTDGTMSMFRLSRRLSAALGYVAEHETKLSADVDSVLSTDGGHSISVPPPPPPPPELTEEVKEAMEAAAARRASRSSSTSAAADAEGAAQASEDQR